MDEFNFLRETAQTIGVVGVLLGVVWGFVTGKIQTKSTSDKERENTIKYGEVVGLTMAKEVNTEVSQRVKEIQESIPIAVTVGVAQGIEKVYPLMNANNEAVDDRLRAIEISIAELRQHQKDNKDRL
jgi:hypothetical protein